MILGEECSRRQLLPSAAWLLAGEILTSPSQPRSKLMLGGEITEDSLEEQEPQRMLGGLGSAL